MLINFFRLGLDLEYIQDQINFRFEDPESILHAIITSLLDFCSRDLTCLKKKSKP